MAGAMLATAPVDTHTLSWSVVVSEHGDQWQWKHPPSLRQASGNFEHFLRVESLMTLKIVFKV